MADKIKNLENHGRETYAVYYGDKFVLKRPLPTFNEQAKKDWLTKQHKTQQIINDIRARENPLYNIPEMTYINDDEYQILEERAPGEPLTPKYFAQLSQRQKFEIINSLGSFLVDMNELKPIGEVQSYKIANDIKFIRLNNFIENKMSTWFTKEEVDKMSKIRDDMGAFEYETRLAWSHGDLNSGNVLYDAKTSKLSFIDFAEANYKFIYRDIFGPVQIELGIYKHVYEVYCKLHDKTLYPMPSIKNEDLREIMKHRLMAIILRRFIKAADDLRLTPANEKSRNNNIEKIFFMRRQMQQFDALEKAFAR